MKSRQLWNVSYGTILAGISAWSASVSGIGYTKFKANLMQSTMAVQGAGYSRHVTRLGTWLSDLYARANAWFAQADMHERERYLAQAQNLADLEDRIRRLDQVPLSRGRALG